MIGRPFSYFGAKHALARFYPKPEFPIIVEPFAGSAGYSCLHSTRDIRLYDVDESIIQAWKFLIGSSREAVASLPLEPPFPQEAEALIGYWLANGRTKPVKVASSWARSGERPNAYWGPVARELVTNISERIKHWLVLKESWERIPTNESRTWFVDPPYSSKGGRAYTHNSVNYRHLAEWCRSLPGQVIVTEEEGATWLPFRFFKDVKTSRKLRTREVIWTNDDQTP